MRNILRKSLMLVMSFLAVGTMLADTETHITPSGSDQVITGISYSIPATYIAGEGGAKVTPMASKGVKFRINRSASGLSNGVEFTVNSGYTITSIQFCGIANDNSKTADVTAVYIDGITEADKLTSFSAVNLPNKKASSAASFIISGFNATQKIVLVFGGNDMPSQVNLEYTITYTSGPAGPSNDATLSSLVYGSDQTSVDNFSSSQTSYEVELPATYVGAPPTIQGTTTDANANITDVTQATSIPGTASITVTAEDGTTTMTYSVTFTRASAEPKVESATWANIKGTASIDQVNKTITGQVTNGSSLTLTPQFTGKNISSISPEGAQNFANGAVVYTFTSSTSEQTTYSVTITEAPAVSSDATLKSLTYGGTSVPGFSPSTLTYNIELSAGIKTPPTIAATPNNRSATMQITQAQSVPGSGKVEVTAEDGETKLTYTINYTVEVPSSDLTIHVPEIYEAKEIAGGYGGTLSVFGGREYEVYYGSYTEKNDTLTITVFPTQKSSGITTSLNKTSFKATDGWFEGTAVGGKSNYTFTDLDEFKAGAGALHKLKNGNEYVFHIQGYDQFSFMGKDNNADASKGRYLQVYIDNVLQTSNLSTSYTVRRFNITTGEHVIKIKAIHDGDSQSEICGFSLRLAQEPRVKYQKGNDSTQSVKQTEAIKPVVYTAKYNNISGAETRLEWIGGEANGVTLRVATGSLSDTLTLGGIANCPVGTYTYAVVAYFNNVETNRATGTFSVTSDIQSTSDLEVEAYQNEAMDPILFRYYALSADDVQLTWPNGQPQGITGTGTNGKYTYTIGGTPTTTGVYPFTITVTGADTILAGQITVKYLDYGDNAVLYLHKNNQSYQNDPVYKHLISSAGGKKNLITRKALTTGLRPAEQYANYKWILISEDADADNAEVLAVVRGGANLPVLNMKGFTYAENRLGWGYPDNGSVDSITHNGRNIFVYREDHPIFKKFNLHTGDKLPIFDTIAKNGIMPITINGEVMAQTLCLATGFTRNIEDYHQDGELQTAIHEIPAAMRGGKKYICMPMAIGAASQLTPQGKSLIDAIVSYLTDENTPVLNAPILQMNSFSIMGVSGTIDQTNNTIDMAFDITKFPDLDLTAVVPSITLADPAFTFVTPASGETVNFLNSSFMPVKFVISDYISTRTYNVTVRTYDPQGIEQVYETGQWVNIFDIFGRMITTTNEDIYSMDLPHGMYLVVTENGQTIKLLR